MWMLPSSVRIYVAAEPMDLRRGFDGLAAATRSVIGQSPPERSSVRVSESASESCEDPRLGSDGVRFAVQEAGARDL